MWKAFLRGFTNVDKWEDVGVAALGILLVGFGTFVIVGVAMAIQKIFLR